MELCELLSDQLLVFGKHHWLVELIVALGSFSLLDRLLDHEIRSLSLPCRVNHHSLGDFHLYIRFQKGRLTIR